AAADVVLESVQADGRCRREKSSAVRSQSQAHALQQVPSQRSLNVDQLRQWARLRDHRQQVKTLHIEELSGGRECTTVEGETAEHHVVDIHLFGHAIRRGPRNAKRSRNAEAVIRPQTVLAASDEYAGRIQPLAQQFGK